MNHKRTKASQVYSIVMLDVAVDSQKAVNMCSMAGQQCGTMTSRT